MAQRNISKAEYGNMRVQITCPCCGSRCKVTASRKMTDRVRYSSVQCLNASCGWSGVAATEVIKTISHLNLDITCLGLDVRPGCVGLFFKVGFEAGCFTTVEVDIACLVCSVGLVFTTEMTNSTTNHLTGSKVLEV